MLPSLPGGMARRPPTWHRLQLYLCGSESALSSELSSFSSDEMPILPMNSSRWWSSISAMSCGTDGPAAAPCRGSEQPPCPCPCPCPAQSGGPILEARGTPHLKVHVDVVPEHIHAKELAPADLAGVLLVTMGEQVLVHVAPAGEHLGQEMPREGRPGPMENRAAPARVMTSLLAS